jgi:hypothetical protein
VLGNREPPAPSSLPAAKTSHSCLGQHPFNTAVRITSAHGPPAPGAGQRDDRTGPDGCCAQRLRGGDARMRGHGWMPCSAITIGKARRESPHDPMAQATAAAGIIEARHGATPAKNDLHLTANAHCRDLGVQVWSDDDRSRVAIIPSSTREPTGADTGIDRTRLGWWSVAVPGLGTMPEHSETGLRRCDRVTANR